MALYFRRAMRHLFHTTWTTRRWFPIEALGGLEQWVTASETEHHGEVQFVIESALDWKLALKGMPSRDRALEWFGHLQIWDTEQNTGILVYVLVADRDIEIVADRGIACCVSRETWDHICHAMSLAFHQGMYVEGLYEAMEEIHNLLVEHFPSHGVNIPNQIPNDVILR